MKKERNLQLEAALPSWTPIPADPNHPTDTGDEIYIYIEKTNLLERTTIE